MENNVILDFMFLTLPVSMSVFYFVEVLNFGKIKNKIDFCFISVFVGIQLQYFSFVFKDMDIKEVLLTFLIFSISSMVWYSELKIKSLISALLGVIFYVFIQTIFLIITISLSDIQPYQLQTVFTYSVSGTVATSMLLAMITYKFSLIKQNKETKL